MSTQRAMYQNDWERPQKRHNERPSSGQFLTHNSTTAHDTRPVGDWGKTLDDVAFLVPHRRHFTSSKGSRTVTVDDHHVLLDGAIKDIAPKYEGRRKYGAGGLAHSKGFLATQEGLTDDCGNRDFKQRTVRKMAPPPCAPNDLILEHLENCSGNRHVDVAQFVINNHKVATKKQFSKKVQVEGGGAPTNFFMMPAEASPSIKPNKKRFDSNPHLIKPIPNHHTRDLSDKDSDPHRLTGIRRRKLQDWTPDYTKRDLDYGFDPTKKHHDVPAAKPDVGEDRKRSLQTTRTFSRALGDATGLPVAGASSERWQESSVNRRALVQNETDLFRESWNFLRHDVGQATHTQEQRGWNRYHQCDVRPQTAPSQSRDFEAPRSRSERLAIANSTGFNLLAGQVNQLSISRR